MGWYEFVYILSEWRDVFICLLGVSLEMLLKEIRKKHKLSGLDTPIEIRRFWTRSKRSNPGKTQGFPPYLTKGL